MRRLLAATRNADKLREIREILRSIPRLEVIDLVAAGIAPTGDEDGIEVFDTFEANAVAKARYFADRSDLPVLADDSGLCVDALAGAPGVHSKRFSARDDLSGRALDAANNSCLLHRLRGVPSSQRTGQYVCVVALSRGAAVESTFRGQCSGTILEVPKGEGGFGYDPLFQPDGELVTFGELPPRRKNRISHRARALRAAEILLRAGWPASDPVDSVSHIR